MKIDIKEIRKEKGMSQRNLANKIGVFQQQVAYWEKSNDIKMSSLEKILGVLGYKIEIVEKEVEEKPEEVTVN